MELRLRGDPGVAGRRVQLLDVGVRGESADQGVLTSTRTENQDLHGAESLREWACARAATIKITHLRSRMSPRRALTSHRGGKPTFGGSAPT